MSRPSSAPDPLNPLAAEFVARSGRGERPAQSVCTPISTRRWPSKSARFPVLVRVEPIGAV
jgi:hypothetical protein